MAATEGRIERLPKWAQDRIADLESALSTAKAQLAVSPAAEFANEVGGLQAQVSQLISDAEDLQGRTRQHLHPAASRQHQRACQ